MTETKAEKLDLTTIKLNPDVFAAIKIADGYTGERQADATTLVKEIFDCDLKSDRWGLNVEDDKVVFLTNSDGDRLAGPIPVEKCFGLLTHLRTIKAIGKSIIKSVEMAHPELKPHNWKLDKNTGTFTETSGTEEDCDCLSCRMARDLGIGRDGIGDGMGKALASILAGKLNRHDGVSN